MAYCKLLGSTKNPDIGASNDRREFGIRFDTKRDGLLRACMGLLSYMDIKYRLAKESTMLRRFDGIDLILVRWDNVGVLTALKTIGFARLCSHVLWWWISALQGATIPFGARFGS